MRWLSSPFIILRSILIVFALLSTSQVFTQNFGSRPKIDFKTFNEASVEKGIIHLKVSKQLSIKFETFSKSNQENLLKVNDPFIDSLLSFYGASKCIRMFPDQLFAERNSNKKALWGFDRWFAIGISPEKSAIDAALSFAKSNQIEVAEPVLKIIRMNGDGGWDLVENSARNPFAFKKREKNRSISKLKETKWLPNDPFFVQQSWHYNIIQLQQAWEIHNIGDNVIVSVHDGGIQFSHPDLFDNIWGPIGPEGSYTLADSHGTHVAGTVAAVSNNTIGVAGVAGGDGSGNGARLMSIDIFEGAYSTYQGYVYAAEFGAAVSQNSWGYESPNAYNTADLDGIDYFYENGGGDVLNGGIVIFAAGNNNTDQNWYPGYYEKTVAVAATTQNDTKASFSNYGTWIDLCAPGVSIYSTDRNSNYGTKQGTSMACPHVSGVAALIASIAPGMLTNENIREILKVSADDIYELNGGYEGMLGTGRLNAQRALEIAVTYAVINPANFTGSASSKTSIDLSWLLNDDELPVLLAYNTTNQFGIPKYEYSVGTTIEGGGEVLYFGSNTSFVHENLEPGTTYYYKVWSYNGTNYSSGLFNATTTICNVFGMPYSIGFDDAAFPNCWGNYSNTEPEMIWMVGNLYNGLYGQGLYLYFLIDSYGFGEGAVQDADLISPEFDFTNESPVYLSFNHYFRHRMGHKASLHYSVNGGENWSEHISWESDTKNPELFSQRFFEVEGQSAVRFKWKYEGSWGWFWCVDSIQVTNYPLSTSSPLQNNQSVRIYPNPFTDVIHVEPTQLKNQKASLVLFDIFGRLLYSEITSNPCSTINLSSLNSGIYILQITMEDRIERHRIVKSKKP